MLESDEQLVDITVAFASDLIQRGSRPEDVISALLGSAHVLAEREDAEDHLRDLLEVFAEQLESL